MARETGWVRLAVLFTAARDREERQTAGKAGLELRPDALDVLVRSRGERCSGDRRHVEATSKWRARR